MFYSRSPLKIKERTSVLDESQVFTGQYWDEFGVTSHLVPDKASVLMLGLAYGGGIRPILASTKNIDLVAVDLDERTNSLARAQFANHFPHLNFSVHTQAAEEFLSSHDKKWDAIWIDIYAFDGYAQVVADESFLKRIQSRLTAKGVALFNLFGIPNQFDPLNHEGPQALVASQIRAVFPDVHIMPFRRNLTVIASEAPPEIYPTIAHPELSPIDKVTLLSFASRLQNLTRLESSFSARVSGALALDVESSRFVAIDNLMRAQWQMVLRNLAGLGVKLSQPAQLLDLIQDEQACAAWLLKIEREESWIEFLPILCAGESDLRPLNVDWIFAWTAANQEFLRTGLPRIYQQIWLPQLWAMVLNPSKRFRRHYFQMLAVIAGAKSI